MIVINDGELLERIRLNRGRMSSDMYSYPQIFSYEDECGWPGDWCGRAILSLCSLYDCLEGHAEEQKSVLIQLQNIFVEIEQHLNQFKYFGEVIDGKSINEQQISGTSWLLRGFIEYYKITKSEKILGFIESIKDNFLKKIIPFYSIYPICDRESGGVSGHIEAIENNGWLCSSDIGCAFIMLDGATQTYELTKDVTLIPLIETIIKTFNGIDYVKLKCQTHATLSFTRGLIRYFKLNKNKALLDMAIGIFQNYINCGTTKDFSNINRFNRPDTWTETCCIVDSYIIANELYKLTFDENYIFVANKIYNNALRVSQRSNGGAGCNTCLVGEKTELKVHLYEAYFCCTMRLAEGLKHIKNNLVFISDAAIHINMLDNFELNYKDVYIKSIGDFYETGKAYIITKGKLSHLKVYIPENLKVTSNIGFKRYGNFIFFKNVEDTFIELLVELKPTQINGLYYVGDRMLSIKSSLNIEKKFLINGKEYSYLSNHIKLTKEEELNIVETV